MVSGLLAKVKIFEKTKTGGVCFFWFFAENNLVLEFRLFVFLLFHDLL